ncbi:glycosyltransferase [Modestobacter sp. SSW1-42]|uniref:glycosyltransferase n=1 Tax=Modestobacter sp. SSW1-42 TaxID=596372 RepID=UPI00398599CB
MSAAATVSAAVGTTARAPRMGVVVVNFEASSLLRANVADRGLGGPDDLVVIVDNSPSADEQEVVRLLCAEHGWLLVPRPDNPGFGAGVNEGIAAARSAGCVTFLCLNPDAVISQEVLDALREHSLRDPLALIAPRIVDSAGALVFRGSRLDLRDGRIRSHRDDDPAVPPAGWTDWLTGACLVVHSALVDRLGGFADDYFLYWEDVDLSHRAQLAGGHLVLRADLTVRHDEGGTQGAQRGRAKSATYYRYNCRNRLLFAARNLPRRDVLRWLVRTPAVSREILLRGGRRQLLHSTRPLRATVRGSAEGVGLALAALVRRRPAAPAADHRPAVLVVHPGAELYGSDRVVLESVTALVAAGHPVTVALPGDGPLVAMLRGRGARVVTCRMPVLRKSALRPVGALRLVADAVAGLPAAVRLVHDSDVVLVNTITIPSWVVLARLLRRPALCHVHEAESSAPRLLRQAMSSAPRLADRVLVNSGFSLAVLADVAPRVQRRAVVVLNGVPGPAEVSPARTDLTGPVRLLFVGRLSPRKGPQVAVAALAELLERGVDARLGLLGSVFEGYEWFEAELQDTVRRLGLTDRVNLLGFRPDIWSELADADVVLVPSVVDEPFGNTAVEAVLAARPVVVSATSGLREAVAGYESAQAVAPGDPAVWADAVSRVMAAWPEHRAAALRDSAEAHRRHAPETYQARVAAETAAVAGRRSRPGSPQDEELDR